MRRFSVSLQQQEGDAPVRDYTGIFEAPNVLNAIGQACLRFAVKTHSIVSLTVEVEEHPSQPEEPATP